MKTSMPARTPAQLEVDSHATRQQAQAESSVLVDRRASTGANLALQAKVQEGTRQTLQAKMTAGGIAQRAAEEDELQMKADVAQRAAEEEELQMKADVTQRAAPEEEMLQGKFVAQRAAEEEELQMKADVSQRAAPEEEMLQGKFVAQRAAEEDELQMKADTPAAAPRQANNTGMPDNLKSGIENLSGYSMDDVKVHYNSSQPAQLGAHAYAQGSNIHVAPGQEQHLPHEAWHVVQQRQGRVQPTMQMAGVQVNDDQGLEHEADVMGAKALAQSS